MEKKERFFSKNRSFYRTLFPLLVMIALQNVVAYSVNMADNIMLGSYGQVALSGAATVNQIFFVVQQITIAIGEGLVVIGSQYWGQGQIKPIRRLTGVAVKLGVICGVGMILICSVIPNRILMIFSSDVAIIKAGVAYLNIIKYTFLLFVITNILMASLRCVGTVKISFYISIVSLVVNVCVNYVLIFGKLGMPEMGIRGAAIGTLAARVLEFLIVLVYMLRTDRKLQLFSENFLKRDKEMGKDYAKVEMPVMISQILWAISVPFQTAILGHLSSDALAANSVATTFYQYLKVVVVAMSSASSIMVGNAIGRGDMREIKEEARTLAFIDFVIGVVLAMALFLLRKPLLSMYNLNDEAMIMANQLIILMSVIMVGMSYQMPVSTGIIRGGGDIRFFTIMNLISVWGIVIPLSFMSAFWWRWPVVGVVFMIQSDQVFKGIPTFIRFRSYKWMKKLTRPVAD